MKKTVCTLVGLLLFPWAASAQSLPTAEEAFSKGDYTAAAKQYESVLENATGANRLQAQLRLAACQYRLGEFLTAAKSMLSYPLPENELWRARFLLYRIQMEQQASGLYSPLLNKREIASEQAQNDLETWTGEQWEAQITQDYEALWSLRAALIQAPLEQETLILNVKDTDTQRLPTLFDWVVYSWSRHLARQASAAVQPRQAETSFNAYSRFVPAQQATAQKLAELLKTAYLLDGKNRQNAKIFWQTDYVLLPFEYTTLFTLTNEDAAKKAVLSELNVLSGFTPQKQGFFEKLKGYVAPADTRYGRAYAAFKAADFLFPNGDREEALKIARFGEKLGDNYYAKRCGEVAKNILQQELSFNALPQAVNPQKATLGFTARNVNRVYVRVYNTSYAELLQLQRKNSRALNSWDFLSRVEPETIKALLAKAPLKTADTAVSYKRAHYDGQTQVSLPPLAHGFYFVLASWDPSFDPQTAPVQGLVLNATDLALFARAAIADNPEKYVATPGMPAKTYKPNVFHLYTVNLKTGATEGNAQLDLITDWNGTREQAATAADGTLSLPRAVTVSPRGTSNQYFVAPLAQKDGQYAYANALYFHFYNNDPVRLFLQMDRAIYRPGQKVSLAVQAFQTQPRGLRVLPNTRITVRVNNAAGKEIFSARPTANDMGTAQAEFTLPQDPMLGQFSVQASVSLNGRTYRTYASFQVEEYKRPDYEITLNAPQKAPEYNKELTLSGQAQYYFGAPLENAVVKYTVSQRPYLPPFFWWRALNNQETTQLAQGETRTDAKGAFKIAFTPVQTDKGAPFSRYTVSATVYDDSGRAITGEKTFTVSVQPKVFQVEFSQGFYDAQTPTADFASVSLTDADGTPLTGKVTVRAARLENQLPAQPQKEDTYFRPNGRSLEEQYKDIKEVQTAFTKTLSFKQPGKQTLALPALPEGVYRLTLSAEKAEPVSLIFIVAKAQSALQLPDVTLWQHSKYYPGETARVLLGAGNLTGSKRVERYRANAFLTHQELLPGGVTIYTLPVTQEDRGGLAVAWFGASQYAFHQGSATAEVPFDNRELSVVVEVPNQVRPGQTAAWKISAQDSTGSSVNAQANITVYDKSLDYYAKPKAPFTAQNLYPQNIRTGDTMRSTLQGYARRYFTGQEEFTEVEPLPLPSSNLQMPRRRYGLGGRIMFKSAMPMMATSRAAKETMAPSNQLMTEELAYDAAADTAESAAPAAGAANDAGSVEFPRTNFAETAYFNPTLPLVNGKGLIRFLLPQSLTTWNVLGFVLTQQADFGSFSAQTVTRKDFMVRLQTPRFYREGDKGVLQAALTNLTNKKLTATVKLFLTQNKANALAQFGLENTQKTVTVGANSTQFVTWEITAPAAPDLYQLTVTARSGKNSDAEQKDFPVYPGKTRLLATQNVALKKGTNTLALPELDGVKEAELQTASLAVHPSLALSVLNSMPNLLATPYKDLVSTLNRYAPLAVVHQFYTTYPQLKQAVAKLPKRAGQTAAWNENDPLRLTLLEQTPWLREAQGRPAKEANLVDLFNPQTVQNTLQKELKALHKFQNTSGAFAWFPGGQDDDYLTLYALNIFAQSLVYQAQIPQEQAQKAFAYIVPKIEARLKQDPNGDESTVAFALYAAYTLSAFPQHWAQSAQAKPYIKRWVDYADGQARFMTALGQTYAAAVYHRLGDDVKANRYLDLVLSRMKQNELTGAYFAPEPQSWIWYRDTLTTQTAALRTLLEMRPQSDKISALTQWLLFNRQATDWTNAKAASQAVFTLLDVMKHTGALSLPTSYQITWAGTQKALTFQPLDWTEDLQFVRRGKQITPQALSAQIVKKGGLTDFASLSVVYTSAEAKASPKGVINVTREYFTRFTQDGVQKLRPVQDLGEVRVGDEVEVHLTVTADSSFEYVLLSDPKPAGFESETLTSGWEWNPVSLYQETKDAQTNFFINWLPAGKITLSYVLRPTVPGRFHAMPAQAQSMYAPEYGAHTAAETLAVEK